MNASITTRAEHRSFGGVQGFYEHPSEACSGPMRFAVYLPPAALAGTRVPILYWLPGLTCTEETFVVKAGAQRIAAQLGLAIVSCDTSPRTARFPGDDEDWDFGQGAGFWLDAAQPPWSSAYRMATWVSEELRVLVESTFPVLADARGIFGHSMGGHGALVLGLRRPELYRSVSALAPIVAPSAVPWGIKAFSRYLGDDRAAWAQWDACELLRTRRFAGTPLVDQGTADKFLDRELQPHRLQARCDEVDHPLVLRMHEGYDHSYFFVASLVEDHLCHHAAQLGIA